MLLVAAFIVLASDHPWVWLAGIFMGLLVLNATLHAADLDEAMRRLDTRVDGHYGPMSANSGMRVVPIEIPVRGERLRVQHGVPDPSAWLLSTLIWMGAAAGGALRAAGPVLVVGVVAALAWLGTGVACLALAQPRTAAGRASYRSPPRAAHPIHPSRA
jgi:hypothetical protein